MSNRFRLGIVLRLREMAEEAARIELSHAVDAHQHALAVVEAAQARAGQELHWLSNLQLSTSEAGQLQTAVFAVASAQRAIISAQERLGRPPTRSSRPSAACRCDPPARSRRAPQGPLPDRRAPRARAPGHAGHGRDRIDTARGPRGEESLMSYTDCVSRISQLDAGSGVWTRAGRPAATRWSLRN